MTIAQHSQLGAQRRDILKDVVLPGSIPVIFSWNPKCSRGLMDWRRLLNCSGREGTWASDSILSSGFDTPRIFGAVVLIAVTAVVMDALVVLAAKRAIRWRAVDFDVDHRTTRTQIEARGLTRTFVRTDGTPLVAIASIDLEIEYARLSV
jgi:hypothetical protein